MNVTAQQFGVRGRRAGDPGDLDDALLAILPGAPQIKLRIHLFGQMTARRGDTPAPLPKVRKTRALLAILALGGGRPVLRERIAALLWSRREREQARASLRQCVHELQEFLTEHGLPRLRTGRQHILLDLSQIWIDAVALTSASPAQTGLLDSARQGFIEDLIGLDNAFDAWIASEEQRLRDCAIGLAGVALDRQTDPAGTASAAGRLVDLAPGSESGWARLIQAHLDAGERSAAEDAYARCVRALAELDDRAPSAETAALLSAASVTATSRSAVTPSARASLPPRSPGIWLALSRLRCGDGPEACAIAWDLVEAIASNLAAFHWMNIVPPSSLDGPDWDASPPDSRGAAMTDYTLDGGLQMRGDGRTPVELRLTLRLLDARGGGEMVWSRRFECRMGLAGFWQDELACEIAAQIESELLQHEARRASRLKIADASPRELMLRAVPAIFRLVEPDYTEAGHLLSHAAALAPDDPTILGWWASWHLFLVGQSFAADPHAARLRAGELAERAVALDPGCARALSIAAHVRSFLLHKDIDETIALHERALALNPSLPFAWAVSCLSLSYAGRHQEAVRHGERARTLSPFDPHSFFFDAALLVPTFALRDFDRAVTLGRRALAINPAMIGPKKGLLAALGHLGRHQDAAELLAKIRAQAPELTLDAARKRSPLSRPEDLELFVEGLRLAGLR
jgi:DNA-binding SARP family transcriptional activator